MSPLDGSLEPEALPAEEAASLAEQADIDGPLVDWKAKGHAVEVVGQETLPGGPAHRLTVTPKSGTPRTDWVDAATGLVVRMESTRKVRGRDVVLETAFGDYQKTAGVAFARFIEATYHSLRRLRKRGWLAMPRRGFHLIVDPGYRELGALPPAAWIDDRCVSTGRRTAWGCSRRRRSAVPDTSSHRSSRSSRRRC